jgi:glycosyltransferase 2 family protein
MRTAIANFSWYSIKRWVPGIIISIVALWLVLRNVSLQTFGDALTMVSPASLILVIALYLLSLGLRAMCWQILLQRKATFTRVLFVLSEGYLLNNLLPLRVGELGRAALLGRDKGLGLFRVLSTIVVERAYDLAIAASLVLCTLPMVLNMDSSRTLAITILSVVILGLFSLYWMARYRDRMQILVTKLGDRFAFINKWIAPKLGAILDGFAVLTRPEFFALSLGLMLLSWGSIILEEFIILRSLVPQAPLWWVGFVMSAAALGAAIPSAPAGLGVFEGFTVGALSLLGVDPGKGLAFAVLAHLVSFTFSNIMGIIGIIREGESVSSLYQRFFVKKNSAV